jgi:hypothetical protein
MFTYRILPLAWCSLVVVPFFFFLKKNTTHTAFFEEKKPVVEWVDATTYDFTEVRFGSTVGTTFTFRNVSPDSILLQTVRTTCGCTAASWPEQPIAPGATGVLRIEYSGDQSGAFRKKIRVFFDTQRKPEILWVQGQVR